MKPYKVEPPSEEFRKRVKVILHSRKLPAQILSSMFQLAVDLEYDLLPAVAEIFERKKAELIKDSNLLLFKDEDRNRATVVAHLIKNWRLT